MGIASLKQSATTIAVPQDFVRLYSITKSGYYIYKVKYRVDPNKAIKDKTLKVIINIASKPFVRPQQKTFTNSNAKVAIKSLQTRRAMQKDLIRNQKNRYILTFISDFTKKIPNNKASTIARSVFNVRNVFSRGLRVRPALIDDLNKDNLSLPVLDINTNKLDESGQTFSNNQLRVAATNLVRTSKRDPAQLVGGRTHSITSAVRSISGTTSKRSIRRRFRDNANRNLIGSFLNKRKVTNMNQMGINVYANVLTREEKEFIEIEETIKIPMGDLEEDKFFIIFQLKDRNDITRQTINRIVQHSKLVSQLEIPVIPPEVLSFPINPIGRILLEIKQMDPNATTVNIYRREMKQDSPNLDATYDFIGEAIAEFGEGYKRVEDIFASTNPIIYRVVPVNSSGILGADFTSVVVTQRRTGITKSSPFERKPKFISFTHDVQENSMVISLRDYPAEPISLRLLKKDLSIKAQTYEQVGDIILIDKDTSIPVTFEDVNVKKDRIYEYSVEFFYKDGATVFASNNLIIEYSPVTSNIVQLNISEPEVVESGDDFDCNFSIEKEIIQTEGDLIKSFLQEQGLITEFQEQIILNRDTLQNLFAIKVTRTNINTGEVEEFGIIQSTDFSDLTAGRVRSVKSLQPGFDYTYNITAYARDPETLFSTLEKTASSAFNTSYTFKPFKFKHPITLTHGNIVVPNSLKRNHSKTTFTFGKVVDRKVINISLADINPSLYEGKANEFAKNSILIQWKVQGNVNKIDHFIIILEILGMRTIIGKSHNVTNTNSFQFVDKLTNQECGELTYYIVPVFFDYSRGTELKTNQVLI